MTNTLRMINISAHASYAATPQFCRKFAPPAANMRNGSPHVALSSTVGKAAKLTVDEHRGRS